MSTFLISFTIVLLFIFALVSLFISVTETIKEVNGYYIAKVLLVLAYLAWVVFTSTLVLDWLTQ